jgi:uncharacterized protein
MSVEICAGLAPSECGSKGAKLSGDPKTEAKGLPFLRAACSRKDASSCHILGATLADPLDARVRDGKMAIEAYTEACGLGDLISCCRAGEALEYGEIVPKDFVRAARLYELGCAPADGMFVCCLGLNRLYKNGGIGLAKDRRRAARYAKRARQIGYNEDD